MESPTKSTRFPLAGEASLQLASAIAPSETTTSATVSFRNGIFTGQLYPPERHYNRQIRTIPL